METTTMLTTRQANHQLDKILKSQKAIQWKKQIDPLIKTNQIIDSLLKQTIKRACLDPSVCQSTLKVILQKTKRENLNLQQKVQYAISAVRCENYNAIHVLINHDIDVLYHKGYRENTLLHFICEKHGWNDEIAFVLKETLENQKNNDASCTSSRREDIITKYHDGMFQENTKGQTPLFFYIQAGCDLEDMAYHLQEEYPIYFEKHLGQISQAIAENYDDMSLLRQLMEEYPSQMLLYNNQSTNYCNESTPLHFACFYQNQQMIIALLEEYKRLDGQQIALSRILILNADGMSPLSHLLLNVGDPDNANVWECIKIIIDFFGGRICVLHLVIDRMYEKLTNKSNYMKIIERLIDRLQINLSRKDEESNDETVLSLLVNKLGKNYKDKKLQKKGLEILNYLLSFESSRKIVLMGDIFERIPLHHACIHGLTWAFGLKSIVYANICALEWYDPVTGLPPFALSAANYNKTHNDLDTLYELLRCNPGIIII